MNKTTLAQLEDIVSVVAFDDTVESMSHFLPETRLITLPRLREAVEVRTVAQPL